MLWFLFALEVSVPADMGTWSPTALEGEVVYSLAQSSGSLLAGTQNGLYSVNADGSAYPLPEVPGPVYALERDRGDLYAGTGEGVYLVSPSGEEVHREGLADLAVRDLAVTGEGLYAATDIGLYEKAGVDGWRRVWSGNEGLRQVNAILEVDGGILIGGEEGLFRAEGTGEVDRVREGAVVSLSRQEVSSERVWAGFRGDPLLLVSEDGGYTWSAAGREVGLNAVNDLVAGPRGEGRLSIGGSGLDDGEGTAGVMTSEDGGESWQTERNRLSNTPVLSLLLGRDHLAIELSLPPLFESRPFSLPADGSRFYAGTNGTGVYTYREPGLLLSLLGGLRSSSRLLEPLLVGLAILATTLAVYYRRRRARERPVWKRAEEG
ncbi:MAG: hypothetical protein H0V53_06775 [Rubrobacter sp.]|nr:hypothetical protein [Rubrobacter sp.]